MQGERVSRTDRTRIHQSFFILFYNSWFQPIFLSVYARFLAFCRTCTLLRHDFCYAGQVMLSGLLLVYTAIVVPVQVCVNV